MDTVTTAALALLVLLNASVSTRSCEAISTQRLRSFGSSLLFGYFPQWALSSWRSHCGLPKKGRVIIDFRKRMPLMDRRISVSEARYLTSDTLVMTEAVSAKLTNART